MPYVRITLAADSSPLSDAEKLAQLQRGVTELMGRLLGKAAELTVVSVAREEARYWSAGGATVAGPAAQVQAFITAGSNSAEEKAAFIGAAHRLLQQVLGRISAPLYVVVQEVPAGDWGYDGLSQAARREQREEQQNGRMAA